MRSQVLQMLLACVAGGFCRWTRGKAGPKQAAGEMGRERPSAVHQTSTKPLVTQVSLLQLLFLTQLPAVWMLGFFHFFLHVHIFLHSLVFKSIQFSVFHRFGGECLPFLNRSRMCTMYSPMSVVVLIASG